MKWRKRLVQLGGLESELGRHHHFHPGGPQAAKALAAHQRIRIGHGATHGGDAAAMMASAQGGVRPWWRTAPG